MALFVSRYSECVASVAYVLLSPSRAFSLTDHPRQEELRGPIRVEEEMALKSGCHVRLIMHGPDQHKTSERAAAI